MVRLTSAEALEIITLLAATKRAISETRNLTLALELQEAMELLASRYTKR